MHLSGHYSNPPDALEAVFGALTGRESWCREPVILPDLGRLGNGVVLPAVVAVMATRRRPMSVGEVHAAVEARLGRAVSLDSVNSCLSARARGRTEKFRRVGLGCYAIPSHIAI